MRLAACSATNLDLLFKKRKQVLTTKNCDGVNV